VCGPRQRQVDAHQVASRPGAVPERRDHRRRAFRSETLRPISRSCVRRSAWMFRTSSCVPHIERDPQPDARAGECSGAARRKRRRKASTARTRGTARPKDKLSRQLSGAAAARRDRPRARHGPDRDAVDEPTSALAREMINEVLDVMVELAREGRHMVVTHERVLPGRSPTASSSWTAARSSEDAFERRLFRESRARSAHSCSCPRSCHH